jgi:anti-anti-sigma regulatory factor
MKRKTEISLQRIRLRHKKIERLRKRTLAKKRSRNIAKNNRRTLFYEEKSQRDHRQNTPRKPKELIINVTSNFSLIEDANNVLSFVHSINKAIKRKTSTLIKIDLSEITNIDIGSIGLLLSKMSELAQRRFFTYAIPPRDMHCRQIIFESGFLEHMRDIKGNKFPRQENGNLLVNRGFDKTSNTLVGIEIRKVVKHLTNREESYRPIFSMVQEMCANSIEHANEENKNWLFSIYYKNTETVCFTMTDIGHGILETLRRKAFQIMSDVLKNSIEVLDGAFNKKYASATSDINRNKGLPKIKKTVKENYVNNLIVITNNVFLDFSNEGNSKMLNKKFNGTFYYWELNKNCIEIWKNRKLQ